LRCMGVAGKSAVRRNTGFRNARGTASLSETAQGASLGKIRWTAKVRSRLRGAETRKRSASWQERWHPPHAVRAPALAGFPSRSWISKV
jgi:hypothetical protein